MAESKNSTTFLLFSITMYILSYCAFFVIFWFSAEAVIMEYFVILNIGLVVATIYQSLKYVSTITINMDTIIIRKIFTEETFLIENITIRKVTKYTRARSQYNELTIIILNPYREFTLSSTNWKNLDSIEKIIRERYEE